MTDSPEAFDRRTWRVVGDPLVRPLGTGPLTGHTVAVKDVFAVAGQPIGAGNPRWLERAPIETSHAWAVQELLGAGAAVAGISRTDEFAYSLEGTNTHYGTPPNPAGPDRISGGSSSGSASAVATGQVTVGLGTDTGGSIRVPAAYQGLYGIRTTHDAIPRHGALPLAPSFDAIGWMTRDAQTLLDVGRVLLPQTEPMLSGGVWVVADLMNYAQPEVKQAVHQFADSVSATETAWPRVTLDELGDMVTLQAFEAWESHGWWLESRMDSLGPGVRERFMMASMIAYPDAVEARHAVAAVSRRLIDWLGDAILVLPTAPIVAPKFGNDSVAGRGDIQRLACVSGIAGMPAVTIPLTTAGGLPCGACLVAAPGRDLDLLELAVDLASTPQGP